MMNLKRIGSFRPSLATRMILAAGLFVAVCAVAITWLVVEKSREAYFADRGAALINRSERAATQFHLAIDSLRRNASVLAQLPPVQGVVRATQHGGNDPEQHVPVTFWTARLQESFSTFARANPEYFQIRFIGIAAKGRELVRIDVANGKPMITSQDRLQNKGDRDYFQATTKLKADEVYLSDINLNQEFGAIQMPYVRTLRASSPVFTFDGKLFGMVVINMDIGPAIDLITTSLAPGIKGFLVNGAGNYLAHPDSSRTFGFDLGKRYTWQQDMPALQVPSTESGRPESLQSVSTAEGLLHVAVQRLQLDSNAPERFLLLGYVLPDAMIQAHVAGVRNTVATSVAGVALLLLIAVILFVRRTLSPLTRLTVLAKTISEGNYSVVLPEATVGEMGIFVQAFGGMLDRIKARDQEIRHAAAEIGRSEARLQTIVENLSEGVAVSDLEGRLIHFNRAAVQMHGFAGPDEYLRLLPEFAETFELSAPDGTVWPVEQWPLARILQGEILRDLEVSIRRKHNGWRRIFSYGGALAHGADQQSLMAVVTIRDITERKAAEQRIRAQLQHLNLLDQITRSTGERQDLKSIFQVVIRSLEDSLSIDFGCVCLHDLEANALRVTSIGVKAEVLAHELTLDERALIDIDANGLGRCVLGQFVYEPDISQVAYPFPERLARGGLRSVVMAPLKAESRVFGVLVAARREMQAFSSVECEFLRQLSEHVALAAHQAQLYGALQQAYEDLRRTQQIVMQEERLRALGQMASGIAHDINNALSPVSLYTESLLENDPTLSKQARDYLVIIQRAVEDVTQTVARMREFYRQREQQLVLTPVDLNQLIQQVLDLTRAHWSDQPLQSGIVIEARTEMMPELPKIMGVESEIREALTNLIFNAVDAMPEGGMLTMRSSVAGNGADGLVIVEVTDTGVGMDEETRRRCLEPFFTTKGERGTGLGLAMVFGMVQRHSCTLEIDSVPGAGTTVRLIFAVQSAIQGDRDVAEADHKPPTRLRLLLIDDDPVLLQSLRTALELDGHAIVTATGGAAAISAFHAALDRGEAFAAVITDLGMPNVDGRRVAAAVKEASPNTPVILLTGWGQRLIAEGDIPAHVDRVLAKPPKLQELREALARLCGPQRAG